MLCVNLFQISSDMFALLLRVEIFYLSVYCLYCMIYFGLWVIYRVVGRDFLGGINESSFYLW